MGVYQVGLDVNTLLLKMERACKDSNKKMIICEFSFNYLNTIKQ